MQPLAVVAAHMRGSPGKLLLKQTRRVTTDVGPAYLVPTAHGWLCIQGPTFQTCHQGLLHQEIAWTYYSTQGGLVVIGIAADDVTQVILTYGKQHRTARLHDDVFSVGE